MAHSGKTMTFATDLVPQEDNIYSLGSSGQRWKIQGATVTDRLTATKPINQIITGTGTAATDSGSGDNRYKPAKWTFNLGTAAPVDGDIITIKIPVAGHDYGVFLSTNNGTNYYPVVCNGTGRLTTHYPINTYITVIFESTGSAASMFALDGGTSRVTVSGGVWRVINYYDSNSNDTGYYHRRIYPNLKAGGAIHPYSIIMQLPNGKWSGITATAPNNPGKSNVSPVATGKAANTSGFMLGHVLLMYANATYADTNNIGTYNIWSAHTGLIDARYSFNLANSTGNGFVAYTPVYIVGTVSGGLFYLDTTKWWTQTLPSSDDEKVYIYIGDAYDWYRLTFTEDKPMYWFKDGALRLYTEGRGIKNITRSGTTFTATRDDGSTFTFTQQDTNKYHKSGSWSGLTYTATAVNSADELKFTIPNKIQTNWELNATSGNSPALLFTRDASLTDWKIFVTSGKLSFQSATDGSTWTERAYFKDNTGDFVATSFTGNGSNLASLNASNLSSGTVPVARLPLATTSAVGAVKIGSGISVSDGTISVTAANLGLGNVENTKLSTWAGSTNITTLGTITTGTWHGTKIANDYIANPKVTIAGNEVSLGGSLSDSTLRESLGLSKALRFVGVTTTDMTGGTATNHSWTGTPAGISNYTPKQGDVVINSTKQDEWVCTSVSGTTYTWERLGSDTSYKIVQSAVSDPTASTTTSTTFIDTISQNANGVITATKKTLPTASSTVAGITKVGVSGGAAAYNHTHTISLTQTGTSTINLAANTVYTLTAGGNSVVFKTPADQNTDTKVTQAYSTADATYPILMTATAGNTSTASRGDTTAILNNSIYANPSTGQLNATSYKVNEAVTLQYNPGDSSLEFIFA